jgi:hypothetical protein
MYSLPAVSLAEKTLYKIQQKALSKFIQLFGYEEKFPQAVVFGPTLYGGMDIIQLFSLCMCRKLESISCHINAKTDLGVITTVVVTWQQIQLGPVSHTLPTPIQSHTYQQIGLHTSNYSVTLLTHKFPLKIYGSHKYYENMILF